MVRGTPKSSSSSPSDKFPRHDVVEDDARDADWLSLERRCLGEGVVASKKILVKKSKADYH
jgi:hypothetical protein